MLRWVVAVVCGMLAWGGSLTSAERAQAEAEVMLDIPVLVAGYGATFFEQVAREFEALRPGVRVRLHGDPRINDKVRIRVMAGDFPDATDAVLLYPNLIKAGRILDLGPWLDGLNWEGDARWRDTFLPGVLERWTQSRAGGGGGEGAVYGLPFAHAVWTLFYNKGMFREHGWEPARTWDEFFALCERIETETAGGAAPVAPVALPGLVMRYGDAFLRAAHYNLAGPQGYRDYLQLEPGMRSDPRFVRAAEVVQRIATRHLVRGWQGMSHTAAQLEFIEGRAAMAVSASWFVNEMRGRLPAGFELGAVNFPVFGDTGSGAGVPPASVFKAGGTPAPHAGASLAKPAYAGRGIEWRARASQATPLPAGGTPAPLSNRADTLQAQSGYYFLFKTGDETRERAAVDFFRYLTSREVARRFVREVDSPVALRAARAEDYSPWMRDLAEMIRRAAESGAGSFDAAPATSAAFQAMINQALTDARYRLMTGRISPEEFGRRLEAAAETERARLAEPGRVVVRHGWAAAGLLLVVAGLVAWVGWRGRPARSLSRSGRDARATGYLGRLRPRFAAGFVGPAFLLFAGFVLAPGIVSFGWALSRWDGFGAREWAGLFNFKWLLLESDVFWFALRNNLYLMIVPALVVVPAALFFAVLIHRGVWGAGVFRVVFLFPNLLGGVAATLLWMAAYDPRGGIVNAGLVACGRWLAAAGAPDGVAGWFLGFEGFAWLAQGHLYGALIPIYLWMACGFNLVLYLAAMESIPAELYEAAALDGASTARQFFSVTLPLIREVLVISAVFLVIGGLNAFELVWLLTSQDPASGSHTLGTLMVSTMFTEFQIGRATAIAVVMFTLVLVGSAAVMRAMRSG
uniref:extracellular solute-binding protein n=1 Tax=Geminisphaera colitermitum TaxID=1148786 RepID=UPI0005B7F911